MGAESVEADMHPKGFIRVKIGSRDVLCRALIDSGNLFGTAISSDLAKRLNLKLNHTNKRVGTAVKSGSAQVIGRVKVPFKIYLENIKKSVKIRPYVLQNLSHPINLGQNFLRYYRCDLYFREKSVMMTSKVGCTELFSKEKALSCPSSDKRVQQVLLNWKKGGGNPPPAEFLVAYPRVDEVKSSHTRATSLHPLRREGLTTPHHKHTSERCTGVSTRVTSADTSQRGGVGNPPTLTHSERDKEVLHSTSSKHQLYTRNVEYFAPRSAKLILVSANNLATHNISSINTVKVEIPTCNNLWDKQSILTGEGLYSKQGDSIEVLMCNHSDEIQTLPANTFIGWSREVSPCTSETPLLNDINCTDGETSQCEGKHDDPPEERDFDKLTNAQKEVWTEFIIRELRLNDNVILKKNKYLYDRVIQAFLRNLGAVARNRHDFGDTNLARMHISIKPGATPVKAKVRPLNPLQERDLQRQIDDWLKAGVIEEANGQWSSALVPVAKKGATELRWCVDFRALNQVTVKDHYPLPNIPVTLNKLSGSRVFSTWDSRGAYHAIKLSPESRDFTAFVSPIGFFRFICTPFGLCNAGQAYSRMVNQAILLTKNQTNSMSYLGDVITHSSDNDSHIIHIENILRMHSKYGLKLNLGKCQIFQESVQYLGHTVSAEGIRMLDSHVTKILEWELPSTAKELQSFLGFVNYYAAFIPEFGTLTAAMNGLRNQKGKLEWTPSMIRDFGNLKSAFKRGPTRAYPDFSEDANPFILDTDYSALCCGSVLSQVQGGQERFIACAASKNSSAQACYPSYKGELLAVVTALRKFEHMLQMRRFILRTDSSAMKYLETLKEYRGIFARWQLFLSEFDFEVLHRPGVKHINADILSRRTDVSEKTPEFKEGDVMTLQSHTPILRPPVLQEVSKQSLREMTRNDATLSTVMKLLESEKPTASERWAFSQDVKRYINIYECLSVRDGLVYFNTPATQSRESIDRICIPESLHKHIWLSIHTAGGHLGISKTVEQISRRFYFPNIQAYVELQNLNCVTCIAKQKSPRSASHIPHRAQYGAFNECLYVDTVGPLAPAGFYQGKRVHHILTIQDGWTRFLVAVPIPDVSTKTIASQIVDQWIHRFSCPVKIHSDNGTGFTSKLMQEVMALFHIRRTYTPPYSPSSNRVERAHKLLGQLLRSDDTARSEDWVRNLSCALFVYNTTTNRFTGLSPLEALTSSKPRLPVDMIFRLPGEQKTSWNMYVDNLKSRYNRIYKIIQDKAQSQITLDNAKIIPSKKDEIVQGDHVYYYLARTTANTSPKISIKWIGPLEVVKRFSDSLYSVRAIGDWCKKPRTFLAVVNKLRKVDKGVYYGGLPEKVRNKITLPSLLKNFHESCSEGDSLFFGTNDTETELDNSRKIYYPANIYPHDSRDGNHHTPVGEVEREGDHTPPNPPPVSREEGDITPHLATPVIHANSTQTETETLSKEKDTPTNSPEDETRDHDYVGQALETEQPRRTTRTNVYRGRFPDGHLRRGARKTRYP